MFGGDIGGFGGGMMDMGMMDMGMMDMGMMDMGMGMALMDSSPAGGNCSPSGDTAVQGSAAVADQQPAPAPSDSVSDTVPASSDTGEPNYAGN
ncbi:hypothetical protein ABZ471_38235 [Streptomyces sp. NPDC005728]|uniref:hypothetical protein n=1 Tax=Streptomyces sp. NPDC005728 TaxID=3157054 RepID=UPI0033F04C76